MSTVQKTLSHVRHTAILDPKDYKIAWIAPLEIEAKAAMCLLDERHHGRFAVNRGDDYIFQAGSMGGHNVVIATLQAGQEYGTGSAAALAGQVKKFFPNLWFGLLVGVAAGLPNLSCVPVRDIRLGDVLVGLPDGESAGLVPYDLGKETKHGFELLRRGYSLAMTEPIIRSAIGSIRLEAPNETKFFLPYYEKICDCEHESGTFVDPGQENDTLFLSDDNGHEETVERPRRSKSDYRRTRVWYGPIGSGDKLLKDAEKRNELRDRYGLIGLEMEAAGTMNRIPVGVIRGVCDYGDHHKNKNWQPYAAAMAASYARALLDEMPSGERTADTTSDLAKKETERTLVNDTPDQAHEPCYYIPFIRNTRFTGRATILTELEDKFFGLDQCQKVALVGLGGIGKTQIALGFAYQMKGKRPDYSIFWIPVLSDETAERAYAEIAKKLRLEKSSEDEDVKELVCQYLSSDKAGKWLLIVDNADDKELVIGSEEKPGVEQYLPQSENGIILMTTRSGHVADDFAQSDVIHIEQMEEEEAKALLGKSLTQKQLLQDETAVVELLTYLTYLPLAITQAASYLRQTKAPIRTYLNLLQNAEDNGMKVLEREFRDNTRYKGSQNAAGTTWIVSFQQIQRLNPLAVELLSFMACIEPKAIPQSMLPDSKPDELEWALGILCSYSFLVRREQNDVFDMHSLVHTATQVWLEKRCEERRVFNDVIRHLAVRFPTYHDAHCNELKKEYLPHAMRLLSRNHEDNTVETYQLYEKVGLSFLSFRRFKEAIKCFQKVCWWQQGCSSEMNSDRLRSEHNLATAYSQDRRTKEAIAILEHVVAVQSANLNEEDIDRLSSEHELASAYLDDQRIEEAIEILKHVVAVQSANLNEEDIDRLSSEHELARAYLHDQRIEEAIKILEHVVAVRSVNLNEMDHNRLSSEHELARAYIADGRIKEAIEMLERIVAINMQVLDEHDSSQLSSKHELARAYIEDGRTEEAIQLLEYVVEVKGELDKNHSSRLISEHLLAYAYLEGRRTKEAIKLLEYVVEVRGTLDKNDQSRLRSENHLAEAYIQDGRIEEAVEILKAIVEVDEATMDENNPDRQVSVNLLQSCFKKMEGRKSL